MTATASTTAKERRHLVAVWNPSYASNAMEEHLRILLELAQRCDREELSQDDVYVWWGKVRSPNRQQRQAHQDDIRARAKTHLDSAGHPTPALPCYRSRPYEYAS